MTFNHNNVLQRLALLLCSITLALHANSAVTLSQVRFHNESADTTRITRMLTEVERMNLPSPGARVVALGKMLLETPYVAHTLEADSLGAPEMLTVNIDQLDCTTFVETVMAMAVSVGERRTSWRDFIYNLERVRYRNANLDGYASRLHYICDWVINNSARGILKDVADRCPSVRYVVKTVDFMTANRDRYPALADSLTFERIRTTEQGYRGHRFPYIRTIDVANKKNESYFRNGDIVALTSTLKNLDVTHMGIIVKDADGTLRLMHASSSLGKVVITKEPLGEFLRQNRQFTGLRLLRLQD